MITRYNYEEFFLLYVDNELSAADRHLVERFVDENPDLKEELDILLQCRIKPDHHLVFTDRDSLLQQDEVINAGNYEEFFLSYIDGELEEEDRRSVEEFVRRFPSRLAELKRLQKTVSVPDNTIFFEHKELLYKKENDRRVIFFPWKIAAAALVAGVIGLLLFNSLKKGNPGRTLSSVTEKPAPGKPAASPMGTDKPGDVVKEDHQHNGAPSVKKDRVTVTSAPSAALHLSEAGQADRTAGNNRKKQAYSPEDQEKDGRTTDKGSEVLAQTDLVVNRRPISQLPVKLVAPGIEGAGHKAIVLIMPAATEGTNTTENSSFATQALLSSSGGSPEDGFDTESSSLKKNKLRGLFRKVSRVLEKNTSREEDDKRSVQIGGFQFALK